MLAQSNIHQSIGSKLGESFLEFTTFSLQANLNDMWVDHPYNWLVVRKFWRVILNDTNWSSLTVFHERVEEKASISQNIAGEGMRPLFLSRGNPYFMMTLSLSSTEWEEGDRGEGVVAQRGMKRLVSN